LYLRRPPAYFPEWRLDRLLQRKAQQGVKIHVIVYKEVRRRLSQLALKTEHEISQGYSDQFVELETYQGDLIGDIFQYLY
jgi:hypothetical protein